jgi:predicted nucleotidyltransferase
MGWPRAGPARTRSSRSALLKFPSEVTALVDQLVRGIHTELGDNLVGIYPRGSLAYGDFIENYSDIDLLVVTRLAVAEDEFRRLLDFHKRIAKLPNPYAEEIEITYIDQESVREFQPGKRFPTLERGKNKALGWVEHHHNWLLERSTIWEYAEAYYGPNPRTLINPISSEDIIQAVCHRLQDWAAWAQNDDDPDWLLANSYKVYFVETMCRAFYTLKTGKLASKPKSVEWSFENLPPGWREFVASTRDWKTDPGVDLSINQPIRRFVLWVASLDPCRA